MEAQEEMTLDERLREIEARNEMGRTHREPTSSMDIASLLAALKRCREQRDWFLKVMVETDLNKRFDSATDAGGDAELLKILEGGK